MSSKVFFPSCPARRSPRRGGQLRLRLRLAAVVAGGLGWMLAAAGCMGEFQAGTEQAPPGGGGGGGGGMLAPPTAGPQVMVGPVAIEPGRVVAHRLNRVEYDNTIRDLFFGMDLRPAQAFPVDNYAEGFDNNAQELRMSNLLLEKYLEAADRVVESVFADAVARGRLVSGCELGGAGGEACARRVLTSFLPRAFRRPVNDEEVGRYAGLVKVALGQGDSAEVGLRLALRAALVSPGFLYRIEPDPPQGTSRALDDFELASRLSYFLWSSMPDEELFARSRAGELRRPEEIGRQVERLLSDAKAVALVDNLAGQWLYTRQLAEVTPDPGLFPPEAFDQPLREAMRAETHLFLREVLFGARSAQELLRADFTFANRRLAEHYGLPDARSLGSEMRRVTLPGDGRRGGLLGQAGWLTVTSHPDTTSPVKRGKWLLAELLCQEPPPAPPGVDNLDETAQSGTMRERLAQHTRNEPCATCHKLIDPMGFGLENYDAIGRWRDSDGGEPIDASGAIPGSGHPFRTPAELAAGLQKDPRFARCLTRKLLTYALGRGMEASDGPALDLLTERFVSGGYRFRALVAEIATSPLMTMRGGRSEP